MARGPLPRFSSRPPGIARGLSKPIVTDAKAFGRLFVGLLPALLGFKAVSMAFDNRSAVEKGQARKMGEAAAARASIGL